MDPITVFQVAASVIAFVDFSRQLVVDTRAVYKSPRGRSSRAVQLATIDGHLGDVRHGIEKILGETPAESFDEAIRTLCQQCRDVSCELQGVVARLTAQGTNGLDFAKSSFAVAAKGIWLKGQVNALTEQLDAIRSQMMMTTLVSVLHGVRSQGQSAGNISAKLDAITKELRQNHQDVRKISDELAQLKDLKGKSHVNREQRDGLIAGLWLSNWRPQDPPTVSHPHDIAEKIIESLKFAAVDYRGDAIPEAYNETYGWIFDESSAHDFPSWLQSDTRDIFWVTGKPGSGKSTLMKFLTKHPALPKSLALWAEDQEVIVARYFFWDGGIDNLQKSREGMMRTLLHSCLLKLPHLVKDVSPRRWALYDALGSSKFHAPAWSLTELLDAFSRLVSFCGGGFRLALFIDGLDEFDGDPRDLVQFIQTMHDNLAVKICVSSRPWVEFTDALAQSPKISMQEFNADDIANFIKGSFGSCKGYRERRDSFPADTDSLRDAILERAEGVFLWVGLVTKTLVRAFEKRAPMPRMRSILDDLPTEIAELYTRIWAGLDSEDSPTASRYLLLKMHCFRPLRPLDIWIADDEVLPSSDADLSRFLDDNQLALQTQVSRRLDSVTRGVLSVCDDNVDFVHRSARSWALREEVRAGLLKMVDPEFEPNIVFLRSSLVDLRVTYLQDAREKFLGSLCIGLRYASYVAEQSSQVKILLKLLEDIESQVVKIKCAMGLDDIQHGSIFHPDRRQVTRAFVQLAALFGIRQYVEEKVSVDPTLLQMTQNDTFPLVWGAVFGAMLRDMYSDRASFRISISVSIKNVGDLKPPAYIDNAAMTARRVRMVQFLLGRRAETLYWRRNGPSKSLHSQLEGAVQALIHFYPMEYVETILPLIPQSKLDRIRGTVLRIWRGYLGFLP